MKILLYGVMTEDNLGGPSLVHGVTRLIREQDPDSEIVCYQSTKVQQSAVADLDVPVFEIPYKGARILLDGIKYKFGIKPENKDRLTFLERIKSSDIVVDLFGICFCENLYPRKMGRVKAIKAAVGKFAVSYLARSYKRKTVKCPASYGPILSPGLKTQARFAAKRIFDVMVARENESKAQMQAAGVKKPIIVSPDLAHLMPYETPIANGRYIGISVSYQIINQWRSDETYTACMERLIGHILDTTDRKVVLIPNETADALKVSDIHVAKDIFTRLGRPDRVSVADAKDMTSTEIKSLIAGSEAFIGSRYHSCVASLSSGVPTMIVGWHYKYTELLHWYGQDRWILSNEGCTSQRLVEMFDSFWDRRGDEREVINAKFPQVCDALNEVGKAMFSKQG